jgi:transposase-like protein
MVSALRVVDSVFKLHVFHATAKTAYLKSIKLKATGSQSTHLTNPVAISYEKCCCRMPRLSNDECNRAVTMLLQGATQQKVATALGVHQTTVHRLQGRLVQFGNTDDRPRSGRPRVTTARQDRLMRFTHLLNRTRTAVETAITMPGTHNHRISAQTVRKTPRILLSEHIVQMLEIHLLLADDLRACNG